ncbi:MAG: protein kinase [Chlamydiia bacterium]|nr:protein kinase [Chlamydiia bacterium]
MATQKSKYPGKASSCQSFQRHKVMVVMDLQSGDLFDALQNNKYSLEKRRQQGLDLLKGLCAMHEAKIIHQDLKPANCLITKDGNLLIADFGGSVIQGSKKCMGTPEYMAPTQGIIIDMKNDVWSAGMILLELVTEDVEPYFKSLSPQEAYRKHASINPKSDEWMLKTGTTKETLRQTPSSDAKMALLIADMLHPKNSERVNAVEALSRYNSLLSNLANAT